MAARKKAAVKKAQARTRDARPRGSDSSSGRRASRPIDSTELLVAVVKPDDIAGIDANLRATFTARGIILSTWGLTDLMPPEMCDEVFKMWRQRLTENPGDPLGRTVKGLDEDIARLKRAD